MREEGREQRGSKHAMVRRQNGGEGRKMFGPKEGRGNRAERRAKTEERRAKIEEIREKRSI